MTFNLRPWRESDAASLARFADNPHIASTLRDVFPCPYTVEDAQAYIRACLEGDDGGQLCFAIEIEGQAAGSVGLFIGGDVYRRSAELGYWLAEPYWGQGIMTRAVGQICRDGFKRFDIVRIYAEPFADNTGSRRVLEHNGFTLEGVKRDSVFKNGRLQDSCLYALLRDRHEAG